jgi:hypothetical protein
MLNLFGEPEPLDSYSEPERMLDDAPVPCERERLWPVPHTEALGQDLLERLYGDLPRRTRLTVKEVCRRLRAQHSHVYDLIADGSLDALDSRSPDATRANYAIYRYSVVRFLFNREFVEAQTRAADLTHEEMDRCAALAEQLRRERRRMR